MPNFGDSSQSSKPSNVPQEIPIHTMNEDLEKMNNPQKPGAEISEKTIPVPIYKEKESVPVSSSPFGPNFSNPVPKSESEKTMPSPAIPEKEIQKTYSGVKKSYENSASSQAESPKKPMKWGAVFMVLIASLVVVAISGGIYYFVLTRKEKPEISEEIENLKENEENIVSENIAVTPVENKSDISIENPNYLMIDTENLSKEDIKAVLIDYSNRVSLLGGTALAEFMVTDNQNNPVSFKKFVEKMQIGLNSETLSGLGDNFSLFIFANDGKPRLGWSVDIADEVLFKQELTKEEAYLAKDIEAIFLISTYDSEKIFGSSQYKGASIRYQNIVAPEELSVDYAIFKEKFILGTTKTTIRAIFDREFPDLVQ